LFIIIGIFLFLCCETLQSSAENDAENNPENDIEIQSQNDQTGAESDDDSLGHFLSTPIPRRKLPRQILPPHL
jgi:hypothetical protein